MRIVRGNIAVLDNPHDQLSRWIEESGRLDHDEGIAVHYLPHIPQGRVVIDAGAALGDHTIAYARHVEDPKLVHAFECNPKMFECLKHNCPEVNCHLTALGKSDGLLWFHDKENNSGAGYVSAKDTGSSTMTIVRPLDNYCLTNVGFIKWDIEGSEVDALVGAKNTIEASKPNMIIELNNDILSLHGKDSGHLFGVLSDLGYSYTPIMGSLEEGRAELLCKPL